MKSFLIGIGIGIGFIASQTVLGWMAYLYGHQSGTLNGRAQIVRECPSAQHGERLLTTFQYPDGRVFCSYVDSDVGYGKAKRWRQAKTQ